MRIAILLVLVACGKSDKKKSEPPPPPIKADKLTVTLDNAPLVIDRAFIKRVSQDVFTLVLGNGKGSCEELLSGTYGGPGNGKAFAMNIQKRVGPTGLEKYVISDLWSLDFDATKPGDVDLKVTGNADKGTQTSIEFAPFTTRQLSVAGLLTANGCGESPRSGLGVPKEMHESKGTILIANKKLAVRGVTVQVRPGAAATSLPNIVISTNVRDCSEVEIPAPVILKRHDGKWFLKGTWLEKEIEGTPDDTKDLTFSANKPGKSGDGPTLVLQLAGKGKFGDYVVELFGTAEAIECTN